MATAREIINFSSRLELLLQNIHAIQDEENKDRVIELNKLLDSEHTIQIDLNKEMDFVDTLYEETFTK